MEEQYVYVIYDPLFERIICVHAEPDKECDICEPIKATRGRESYPLEEDKQLIQTQLKDNIWG